MEKELQHKNEPQEELPLKMKKNGSGYVVYIVVTVLLLLILGLRIWWTSSFGAVKVDGDSMRQTLQDGDGLLMKFVENGKGLKRGDIIVVDVEDYGLTDSSGAKISYLIKRLIAVQGDKVRCTDGQVEICYAGTDKFVLLKEPYVYYDGSQRGEDITDYDFAEYTVGEGEIFFLGDNRLNSCDSRYKEWGGSHLEGTLYKATDVYGVVPDWAIEHKDILEKIFNL